MRKCTHIWSVSNGQPADSPSACKVELWRDEKQNYSAVVTGGRDTALSLLPPNADARVVGILCPIDRDTAFDLVSGKIGFRDVFSVIMRRLEVADGN